LVQDGGLAETRWVAADVQRLYRHHGAALVAYARSFLPDAAAAEDAVHSVFLRLLGGDVMVPDAKAGYLYRAVKNAALNAKRDVAREAPIDVDGRWFVHRGGDTEAEMALQKALGELPEEQREVVMMRVWSGMTLEEIGTATGVSPNTAASRYRYALEKLRKRLGERARKGRAEP
jgi:RNA polymerase sigma-70 factor (ECF subfamily)